MRNVLGFLGPLCLCAPLCLGQSDSVVYTMTNPIQTLSAEAFPGEPNENTEPYHSGLIMPSYAATLLVKLGADQTKTTMIHILRWDDDNHSKTKFEKWYLFDPTPSKTSFYLQSQEQAFQRTAIPGRTDFQFVYIHLNKDLSKGESEWAVPSVAGAPCSAASPCKLKQPVSYKITVAKAQTQFVQDIKTVLQIVGLLGAAAVPKPSPGYYSFTTFISNWTTSTITIAGSFKTQDSTVQGSNDKKASPSELSSSKIYNNEKPSYIGLSAGVPVTKYKDVTYQSTNGTLASSSIKKQNAYVFLDGYLPPVLPSLVSFRYIPQPFFGLPLTGKVFRHSMLGAGIGLHWLEPFGGVIFDTQNQVMSGGKNTNKLTLKGVFGLKISVSALGKALKSSK